MPADRYLKVILTVIAIELGWIAIKDAAVPVTAQQREPAPTPVVIRGVNLDQTRPQETLAVTLRGDNAAVPVFAGRPLQLAQPVIIQADRPIPVEAPRPLLIQSVPATASPRPGPGE
jgi:hypothetical protein